jgi:competence protein ComEA
MSELPRNKILGAFAVIAVIAGVILFNLYKQGKTEEAAFTITGTPRESGRKSITPAGGTQVSKTAATEKAALTEVTVHVAGAVKNPGVYHLKPELRADDAIKTAGGSLPTANLDAINLAAKLEDGTQLFVPIKGTLANNGIGAAASSDYAAPVTGEGVTSKHGRAAVHSNKLSHPGKEYVNINSAGESDLQKLPGVGPSMAARILQHRKESGKFAEPEQLMDVSGIGEKKFAKMRPFVKVR